MKVIAINDAPTPKNGYSSNGVYLDRAYYKGDIFDSYETFGDERVTKVFMVIWHDKLGTEMEVDSKNFIKLEEHRNQQIDKIL
jgi:hypothetical protein